MTPQFSNERLKQIVERIKALDLMYRQLSTVPLRYQQRSDWGSLHNDALRKISSEMLQLQLEYDVVSDVIAESLRKEEQLQRWSKTNEN